MYIVCATDNNFVQHCVIMLVSLLQNNKNVEIYVLSDGLSAQSIKIIEDEVHAQNGHAHFISVPDKIAKTFPMSNLERLNHISRATYLRLLIPELLPQNIDKVIYFDCDIIINSSIEELWNYNLSNMAIAAVLQIGSGSEAERLGYPITYGYFNAGVTVVNLKYCREHNICNLFMDYIHKNGDKLLYNDQDVLNGVLYDKCLHILPQWNMTSLIYTPDLKKRGDSRNGIIINTYSAEKQNAIINKKNPPVLHFVSRPKPWQNNCIHPLYQLYYKYAYKTIYFKNIKPQNPIIRTIAIIKHYLYTYAVCIKQRIHKTDLSRL